MTAYDGSASFFCPKPTSATVRPPSPAPVNPSVPNTGPSYKGFLEIKNFSGVVTQPETSFVMVGQKAYNIGGRETQDVDVFDPVTRTWSKGAKAPRLLHHMQCVHVDDEFCFPAAWTDWYPKEKRPLSCTYLMPLVTLVKRHCRARISSSRLLSRGGGWYQDLGLAL
jgi:hypothetical protein